MRYFLFFIGVWITCFLPAQIIFPSVEQCKQGIGKFSIRKEKTVNVYVSNVEVSYVRIFKEVVLPEYKIRFLKQDKKADITFRSDSSLPKDAYRLLITPARLEVYAADNGGFIYAVQTLRQWVEKDGKSAAFVCGEVMDKPRVGWRSFLLDSGRQYQKVSTVKKYIDMVSMLKMNYLQWHLTEGLGWRIEIKKYPLLTEIGAFVGKGAEQQGYYTQDEIREIVKYATERNVTIVPEIDMPGHAEAALSAYPEWTCFGDSVKIPLTGFTGNIFCAGKDKTFEVLKNIVDEVCELFPSAYIHLGGDEAPKSNWNKCADCQRRIKEIGLKDSHDLQLWFSSQMASHLKAKGRKAIFWGDVVYQDGYSLPDNVIIQWWNFRGHRDLALKNALSRNLSVICGTNNYTYLNFPVTPWSGYKKGRTFGLSDVYLHNPSYRPEEKNEKVIGMSCALWTDYGVTENMIDRRLFPRILAISEQMWYCGKLLDFSDFYHRIKQKQYWFEQQGFEFGPALKEEVLHDYQWD